jgi:DeoR family transcriptional regulator, suf operon transcriptional repressor
MSEVHPVPEGGEGFVVTEYNCAIAHIAESFPTVCGHELELFMALFPDCLVKRTHWMIRGQNYCGYSIQPINSAHSSSSLIQDHA